MQDIPSIDSPAVAREVDGISYSQWRKIESEVITPLDRVSEYKKYLIRSYLYSRSRLVIPGRCHEDNDHGPLSIGGNAHLDVIDLDIWLKEESTKQDRDEILHWMNDSSQEQVSYLRGSRHASKTHRRRNRIVDKLNGSSKLNASGA